MDNASRSFLPSSQFEPPLSHSPWRRFFPYYFLIWFLPFLLFKLDFKELEPSKVKPIGAVGIALVYGVWLWLRFRRRPERCLRDTAAAWGKALLRDAGSLAFLIMLLCFCLSRLAHLSFEGSLLINPQQRWEGLLFFIALFVLYRMGKNAPVLGDSFWSSFGVSAGLSAYCRIAEHFKFPLIVNPTRLIIGDTFRYYSDFDGYPYSTLGNPNFFSTYLALTLPICLYLLLQRNKLWALLPLCLQFVALIMNESRSGMVGMAVALPVYWLLVLFYEKKKRPLQWALLIGLPFITAIGFIVLFHYFPATLVRLKTMAKELGPLREFVKGNLPVESVLSLGSNRGYGYFTGFLAVSTYPWLGLGFGNIREATKALIVPLVPESFRAVYENYHTPHNVYLQRAAESGLPSLACYLLLILNSLLHAFRKLKTNPRYAFLICAVLSYAVQAMFNVATPGTSWLFYFLLGLAAGDHGMDLRPEDGVRRQARGPWQKIWAFLDGRY